MYTRRNIRWSVVFTFAWWQVLVFLAWAACVVILFKRLQRVGIDCSIPIAPLGTIGVAVAFYVGFKNNQSYDRNWEARRIWGGIVNVSRSFANQVLAFVSAKHSHDQFDATTVEAEQRALIYRHLAWIHALRFQLRRKTPFGFQPTGSQRRFMQQTDGRWLAGTWLAGTRRGDVRISACRFPDPRCAVRELPCGARVAVLRLSFPRRREPSHRHSMSVAKKASRRSKPWPACRAIDFANSWPICCSRYFSTARINSSWEGK